MFENWTNKITYVCEIVENGSVLAFEVVENLIGPSPKLYLEYMVVFNALTNFLRKDQNNIPITHASLKDNPNAKSFRNFMTENTYSEPCSVRFWMNKFNCAITKDMWSLAWNTTQEVRLRELQWKILHNIYPTNILLLKMGLANNDRCALCNTEIDYIEHFFFSCKIIEYMWKYVTGLIRQIASINITLNEKNVLFGIVTKEIPELDKQKLKTINHILLIAKMCISKYRYGTPINLITMIEHEMLIRNVISIT